MFYVTDILLVHCILLIYEALRFKNVISKLYNALLLLLSVEGNMYWKVLSFWTNLSVKVTCVSSKTSYALNSLYGLNVYEEKQSNNETEHKNAIRVIGYWHAALWCSKTIIVRRQIRERVLFSHCFQPLSTEMQFIGSS